MNSARTLADRFRSQRTDRIRVDGIEVLSMTEIIVDPGSPVEVVVEEFRDDVEQSLQLRAKKAELVVVELASANSSSTLPMGTADGVTLVADRRRRLELAIADSEMVIDLDRDLDGNEAIIETAELVLPKRPTILQVWNSWLIGGAKHAWTGNSGIVVEELNVPSEATARFRLWCSDGLGDPQFDDLVVVVTIGSPS
ncbi:MAG: hypothetical protein ACI81L_001539 [Verrucomicrobiales bacterium]